jgi:hypothetical protein
MKDDRDQWHNEHTRLKRLVNASFALLCLGQMLGNFTAEDLSELVVLDCIVLLCDRISMPIADGTQVGKPIYLVIKWAISTVR